MFLPFHTSLGPVTYTSRPFSPDPGARHESFMPQGDSGEVGPRDKGSFSLVFRSGSFCLYFPIRPVKAELQNDGWGRAGGRRKKTEDMLPQPLFSKFRMNPQPLLIPRQKSFCTQACSLIKMMPSSAPYQWLQVDHPAKQLSPRPNTKELYTWVKPTPHNICHVNSAQLHISHYSREICKSSH